MGGFEVYIFVAFGGLFLSVVLILVGIVIGGCIDTVNRRKSGDKGTCKNSVSNVRKISDNNSILHSDDTDMDNSDVGDIYREVDSGQDMGYIPSTEQITIVLNTLPKTAHLSPHETLCVEWAAKIIDKVVELVGVESDDGK